MKIRRSTILMGVASAVAIGLFPALGQAIAINDTGQIAGTVFVGFGYSTPHGFLWDGSTYTRIDPPGSVSSTVSGINEAGQLAGGFSDGSSGHGFLKTGSAYTSLDVPGGIGTEALGINEAGQVVGRFFDGALFPHGFLWDGSTYATFDPPGSLSSEASGINAAGQVVGSFFDGTTEHGYLREGAHTRSLMCRGAETRWPARSTTPARSWDSFTMPAAATAS